MYMSSVSEFHIVFFPPPLAYNHFPLFSHLSPSPSLILFLPPLPTLPLPHPSSLPSSPSSIPSLPSSPSSLPPSTAYIPSSYSPRSSVLSHKVTAVLGGWSKSTMKNWLEEGRTVETLEPSETVREYQH